MDDVGIVSYFFDISTRFYEMLNEKLERDIINYLR